MAKHAECVIAVLTALALALSPQKALSQPKLTVVTETTVQEFNVAQLDAMLAPIALYPDELLAQLLMASTYPLQVVAAARWLEKDDNKKLKGDALAAALLKETWDPSVKSLVPFPQILTMLNEHLEWMHQLGYAVASQQAAVLDSIQRLRRQAQKAGSLQTTEQQRVVERQETVIIEPVDAETVYVPVYQPANVYGEWPYPSTPPVYIPPPEAYYPAVYAPGYAWGTGLAFAAGAAVVAGLWGWARPGWGHGNVNINAARYNNINANRSAIQSGAWRAGAAGIGGRPARPPGGPVGMPARASNLPTNAIGRGNVQVPGSALNRPQVPSGGAGLGQSRPGGFDGVQRPGSGRPPQLGQRPGGGQGPRAGQLPARGQGVSVLRGSGSSMRPGGAFGGVGDGGHARQLSARGAQSMGSRQSGAGRAGGFQARAGGGGFQGGGFRGGGGVRGGRR